MEDISTNSEEQMAAAIRTMVEVAELYEYTFNTESGMKVLEHLNNMTSLSSLQANDMMDAQVEVAPSDFMFIREGQDQVVRFIVRMMQFYRENK